MVAEPASVIRRIWVLTCSTAAFELVRDRRFDSLTLLGDAAGELSERLEARSSGPLQPRLEQHEGVLGAAAVEVAQLLGEQVGAVQALVSVWIRASFSCWRSVRFSAFFQSAKRAPLSYLASWVWPCRRASFHTSRRISSSASVAALTMCHGSRQMTACWRHSATGRVIHSSALPRDRLHLTHGTCRGAVFLAELSISSLPVCLTLDHSDKEDAMNYMLLIQQGDTPTPRDPDAWARLSEDEQKGVYEAYRAINDTSGVSPGVQMQPPEMATTVRVQEGKTLTTDGPFVEMKEALGGYLFFEADDLDLAIELASRIPAARMGGAVEVRPIVEW